MRTFRRVNNALQGELMFDPWLVSRLRVVNTIADNIIGNWGEIEPPRQRRHKAEDLKRRDTVIRSAIANLAFAAMSGIRPPDLTGILDRARWEATAW